MIQDIKIEKNKPLPEKYKFKEEPIKKYKWICEYCGDIVKSSTQPFCKPCCHIERSNAKRHKIKWFTKDSVFHVCFFKVFMKWKMITCNTNFIIKVMKIIILY